MSTDNSVTSVVKDIEQYEVAKKKAEEILKKDPLAVIPIDMYGTVETEDPFDIIEFFTPTIDDIEVVASKLIESIPIVGDVLGVVFQLFWQRATDEDKQKKKELEERLAEFKKEMIEIIDKKIEASEIEQWKRNCQSLVDGLASTLETLKDALERLRYQLVNGENVDPVSRESIRTKIDILRNDIKKVYIFTSDPKFVKSTIPHFLEAIFLYIFLIRSIDYFWYQWGIPEIEVVGRPATDKSKRLKSLREKLHEKIIDGLSIITENCQDADMLKNAHLILKNDLVLYPVPLIVGTPIKAKDQLKEKIHELDYSYVPEITIPEHSIPFIYRMDASCLRQDPKSQNISSMKRDFKYEPISGCHGQYLSGELLLKVNFPDSLKGKKVMIRLLSMHDSKYEGNINISFGKEIEQIPMIKEKISIFRKKDLFSRVVKKVSGMTYSKKFKINNSQNLSIHHNLRPVKRSDTTILDHLLGKVLFVEFNISPNMSSSLVFQGEFQHIIRIYNTNVDGRRKIQYALTCVKGVGRRFANLVCKKADIDTSKRAGELSKDEVERLTTIMNHPRQYNIPTWFLNRQKDIKDGKYSHCLANQIDVKFREDLERLKKIRAHRGVRHHFGLRVRGQKTKTTGRRGRTVGVAGRR